MRYFAAVKDGVVQRVSIGENPDTLSKSFTWVETFQDGGDRKHMAVTGGNYDSDNDVFYAEKPFDLKVLRTDVDKYIESDEELIKAKQKREYLTTVVDYLDRTLRQITNRTFTIKNAIDWRRFTSGAV